MQMKNQAKNAEVIAKTEEDCKDLENFGGEKIELILETVLDKLDDDTVDEDYKREWLRHLLGMTYRTPPPILIEKVEVTRIGANVAAIRAELIKEMDTVGSVQKEA
ncbi:hypothetical protein Tco_0763889 [Tanacetum coccineum]